MYWSEDICPYLNWRFTDPNIIFSLFKILINGRWYKPASGLLEWSNIKVKKPIKLISDNFVIISTIFKDLCRKIAITKAIKKIPVLI